MNDLSRYALLSGRILLAAIFIISGFSKLMDPDSVASMMESAGLPVLLLWPAIMLEIVGGLMLATGLGTRVAAVALAVFTLIAGLAFHYSPDADQAANFYKNAAIIGGLTYVVAFGAGPIALGQLAWRKRRDDEIVDDYLPEEAVPTG